MKKVDWFVGTLCALLLVAWAVAVTAYLVGKANRIKARDASTQPCISDYSEGRFRGYNEGCGDAYKLLVDRRKR